jgi:hypothetical protein
MIRAKFKCEEVNQKAYTTEFVLVPVVGGSPENDAFFRTTPAGRISVVIKNDETAAKFEIGKFYYVDFSFIEVENLPF